ncbi:MAG: phage tail protein [Anaerolineales bacterium]|nr:phage tail protein [Anaerolineales bacterium]
MIEEILRAQANTAFRFIVTINGMPQAAFTECTLPSIDLDVEEVKEGGLNSYTHQLPGRRKATKITLKNGVGKSMIMAWYIEALFHPVTRKNLTILLLGPLMNPVMVWHVQEAYPVKWDGPNLRSGDNSIAIQTLELVCGEVMVLLG